MKDGSFPGMTEIAGQHTMQLGPFNQVCSK